MGFRDSLVLNQHTKSIKRGGGIVSLRLPISQSPIASRRVPFMHIHLLLG